MMTLSEEELEQQFWVSTWAGELLAVAPHLPAPPHHEMVAEAVLAYVNGVMEGNFSAFARRLSVHRRTAWEWGKGTQTPQLGALLQLFVYLETSPVHFFQKQTLQTTSTYRTLVEESLAQKPKKHFWRFEAERLQIALECALQEESIPPPSMHKVAKQLQYDPSHLYKHFPDLCQAIAARYRTYQKQQRQLRLQQICDEVQQTAQILIVQGYLPNERQVGKRLTARGILKEKAVRTVLYRIRQERGEKL
jgi:hypothetical protein